MTTNIHTRDDTPWHMQPDPYTPATLRDQFAMAALTGILPGCEGLSKDDMPTVAGVAYDLADAMLSARAKEGKS